MESKLLKAEPFQPFLRGENEGQEKWYKEDLLQRPWQRPSLARSFLWPHHKPSKHNVQHHISDHWNAGMICLLVTSCKLPNFLCIRPTLAQCGKEPHKGYDCQVQGSPWWAILEAGYLLVWLSSRVMELSESRALPHNLHRHLRAQASLISSNFS